MKGCKVKSLFSISSRIDFNRSRGFSLNRVMKRCAAIAFLMLVLPLAALPLQARTIEGRVLSSNDSTAVTGAMCRLVAGEKPLVMTSADADGAFSLATDERGALRLEVSMTGFSPTEILIEAGSKNIHLGNIYLDEGVKLGEVTVTANTTVSRKGRTIVFPSVTDVKSSTTSISLFQKLPLAGLSANPVNRTLTVDGGSPMILINGVPSDMADVNALQPKDIEKIEYSRVTPARYADKGTTGVIMITVKKRNDGGQVYAWGRSALNTAFMDGNVRASYHQGASQWSLYYNPSWRNYQAVYDNTTEAYIGNDFRVDLEEHDRNPFNYVYHQVRLKYDFSPSEKTLFSATFSAMPMNNRRRTLAHTSDSEAGEYDNFNRSTSKDFAPSLDLFLRQDFNDNNSLEVQVVGTLSQSDYRRDNQYFYPDGREQSYVMNVDSRRRSLISEINYIHNFGANTQLSAGFQNTVSHSTNTYLTSDYKPVLTENNNYVYARLGQQINKVYVSASTGAKLFWIKNDMNKRHFIRNLTTVQATWGINNQWNVQGAFRYSPSIPSLSALTDYAQQITPYLMTNGNPDLKVAELFVYQIMPSFQYKKLSASLLMGLVAGRNGVVSDVAYVGDRLFLSQSVNSKSNRTYSSNLNVRMSDLKGFGFNVSVEFARYTCSGEKWSHSLNSVSGSVTVWWNKGPYTISYWREIPGKYMNGHYVGKGENGDALQFDWKPNKHWTIGASWMYMFDRKGTRYPSWNYSAVNPSYTDRYIKNNGNMVVLSVSYSADFGKIFRTGRRNLNNSDSGSSLLRM
ncbi:MAG: hypothetical protein K2M04_02850 [Muribaculaceae bacterium]|nr:hypothetical protein [Muribaculaceae bacterium]